MHGLDFRNDGVKLLADVLDQFRPIREFHEYIGLEGLRRPVEEQAVGAFARTVLPLTGKPICRVFKRLGAFYEPERLFAVDEGTGCAVY